MSPTSRATTAVPSSTSRRPSASMSVAAPTSTPPPGSSTRTCAPSVASRVRYRIAQIGCARAAHRDAAGADRAARRGSPPRPRSPPSEAAPSGAQATLRPIPTTTAPVRADRCARTPDSLRPSSSRSFGHFRRESTGEVAVPPRSRSRPARPARRPASTSPEPTEVRGTGSRPAGWRRSARPSDDRAAPVRRSDDPRAGPSDRGWFRRRPTSAGLRSCCPSRRFPTPSTRGPGQICDAQCQSGRSLPLHLHSCSRRS